jgi:glucokinase
VRVLTGDIGGTNTRLAMLDIAAGHIRVTGKRTFASSEFGSLGEIIAAWTASGTTPDADAAAFGVAGPVRDSISRITNLPWIVSQAELREQLALPAVHLLNDLEALAWGIETLRDDELATLQAGRPDPDGNRAVIAAGTGLGQAGLYFDGTLYQPFATEGGHTDFAATRQQDWDLLVFLQEKFGRVSWERVVSGPGLVLLYEYLLHRSGESAPDWLNAAGEDPAAAIAERAGRDGAPLCSEALDWFVRLYGAEAGNLALKMKATGGLYVGGGIAPKILPALQQPAFMEAFLDKGSMRSLMEAMPVQVICNGDVALQGLACYAARCADAGGVT